MNWVSIGQPLIYSMTAFQSFVLLSLQKLIDCDSRQIIEYCSQNRLDFIVRCD